MALMAAGRGARFGGSKLDAKCAGKRAGQWVVEAVANAGLPAGICVSGPELPRFVAEAVGWGTALNPAPDEGLGSSIAISARRAAEQGREALLVVLADMPLVSPMLLRELAAQTGPAATDHGSGRAGVPALFPAALYPVLVQCGGKRGGAQVLAGLGDLVLIEPPAGTLLDIDTPADFARAEEVLSARGRTR